MEGILKSFECELKFHPVKIQMFSDAASNGMCFPFVIAQASVMYNYCTKKTVHSSLFNCNDGVSFTVNQITYIFM